MKEKLPIIITGGAGATGSEITIGLAASGIKTFVFLTSETRHGETAQDRFNRRVVIPVSQRGGTAPIPFYTDITDPQALQDAFADLDRHLEPGQEVHFFSLAAAGFRNIAIPIGRVIVRLDRRMRTNTLSVQDLVDATEELRIITTDEDKSLLPSRRINSLAPINFYDILNRAGRLGPESITVNLSSSPTDDSKRGESVNAFYLGIAAGKGEGEAHQEERSRKGRQMYLNLVAPVIKRTEAADFAIKVHQIVSSIVETPALPFVTIDQVTFALLLAVSQQVDGATERIRRLYLNEDGHTSLERHPWPSPLIPYL